MRPATVPEGCPPATAPARVAPPEPRTAQAGDGEWSMLANAGSEPAVYRTLLHPHPQSRFVTVTLAAVDRCRVRIGFMPGVTDKPEVKLPVPRGLVPENERAELIAVFNGGYKPEHGRWGMHAWGTTLVPARDGGCTLLLTPDGKLELSSQKPETAQGLAAYRQTPPCLLENAALHPRLAAGDDKPWGGRAKDVVTRRRSALGVSGDGRFLFYAAGEEAGPLYLAKALLGAGAKTAAQLDINWYWTRFLVFGSRDGKKAVSATLIPGMEHQPTSYVERPSDRDFFYVLPRAGGTP